MMIEHSENAFYYPDKIKFSENREFTESYPKRISTQQYERNSQEETETFFDKHNSKAQQRKQSVTLG